MTKELKDKYSKLTIIEHFVKGRAKFVRCVCDCGREREARLAQLTCGVLKSCGCLKHAPTHGRSKKPEYKNWAAMIGRCTNPNNWAYKHYGGRGITVCDKWMTFQGFFDDMGLRPSKSHSLDRRDNERGYSKDNCFWATKTEQSRNTRRNVILLDTKTGIFYNSVPEACELLRIKITTLNNMLNGQNPNKTSLIRV